MLFMLVVMTYISAMTERHAARCKTNYWVFLLTIATAVAFQSLLYLPAVIGLLTGLSYLQFFGYYLKKTHQKHDATFAD